MSNKSSRNVLSDTASLQSIRDFFASEKPPSVSSVDVCQIVYLIAHKAAEKEIYDSQQTVTKACGCDVKTIVRSQKRLEKLGWISRPQRRGRTNALSLQFQNIPSEQAVRAIISQGAKTLATRYMDLLKSKGLRRKFPNHWLGRQHLSAQKILNQCNGSLELAEQIVSFAVISPRLQGKAKKSLYELNGVWPRVRAMHSDQAGAISQATKPSKEQPIRESMAAQQTRAVTQPSPIPAYTVRKPVHSGVGLRWNEQTGEVEDITTGAAIRDGEVHQRIIAAGLFRDLLSKRFQHRSTREFLPPDEVNERLMGTEAWQAVMQSESMEMGTTQ